MLAVVGLLSEQQKQGVVALLGGGADSLSVISSDSSSVPLPEPASLLKARLQGNLALSTMYLMYFAAQKTFYAGLMHPEHFDQLHDVPKQLAQVFGEQQLLWMQNLKESAQDVAQKTADACSRRGGAGHLQLLESTLIKEYTTWVQACLLKIIDEVLREHAT
jgi:uncharacterized protein YcgL (UPF0745 family)